MQIPDMYRKSVRELQMPACEELREEENLNSAAWENKRRSNFFPCSK